MVARAARRIQRGHRRVPPTRASVSGTELPTGKDVFGVAPRVLAAVGSGVAALVIIGGALWSVCRSRRHADPALRRRRRSPSPSPRRLVLGNVLIAAGTLVLSASGTLAGRLGKDRRSPSTLLTGIIVLFAGFLVRQRTVGADAAAAADDQRAAQQLAADVPRQRSTNRIFVGHL